MGGITWAQHNVVANPRAGFLGCVLDPFGTSGSRLVFYTRSSAPANLLTEKKTINGNGHVGIGQPNPTYPLNFANTLGDKVALFVNGSNNYGLGIQSGLLQIHTSASNEDIAFGYGSSGALTERFRIKGNGALAVGGAGNTGTSKQILMSNGNGTAPTWTAANNIVKYEADPALSGEVGLTSTFVELLGTAYTVTVTVPTRVILLYKSDMYKICSLGECPSKWQFSVYLNNSPFSASHYQIAGQNYGGEAANYGTFSTNGPDYFDLPVGTHTFTFQGGALFNNPTISRFQAMATLIPL